MTSKRRKKRKECGSKARFSTIGEAIHHLRANSQEEMHPYRCPWCREYHIGHPRGKRRTTWQR